MPINLGLSITGIQAAQFDPDALAFISAATITDTTQRYAINNLVVGLKLNSLWSKFSAIYPFAGSTATTQKWNLKDPRDLDAAYRLSFSGGWTHTSTGALPNGTNSIASTFYTYADATTNSTHLSYYSRTNSTPGTGQASFPVEIGNSTNTSAPVIEYSIQVASGTSPNISLRARQYSDPDQGQYNGQIFVSNSGSSATSQGFYISTRTSSTSFKVFKNGAQFGSNTTTSTFTLSGATAITIARGAGGSFSNRECALASIGLGLTDAESLTFTSLVQRYQTALSRAIVAVPTVQDLDAQNFLVAASITDATQAQAVQNLTAGLKFYSLWAKLNVAYPFVGGSATTHSFNLKNPVVNTLTFTGGWTQSSTGALPNGTNSFADTFLIPSTSMSQDDIHISYYSRTNSSQVASLEIGTQRTGTIQLGMQIRSGSNNINAVINSLLGSEGANANSQGFYIGNRKTSAEVRAYKNGTLNQTTAITSASPPDFSIFLGARNNQGSADLFSNRQAAFASAGLGFSDAEAGNFNTVVQAYQTALSRNV